VGVAHAYWWTGDVQAKCSVRDSRFRHDPAGVASASIRQKADGVKPCEKHTARTRGESLHALQGDDSTMRNGFLIINADDFGLSTSVNRAVVASLQASLCSSTTIMANQPAFLEACQLAHDHRLFDRVGVHLVLTEGSPLTEAIKGYE
jgi:hypothetical protein